MKTKMTFHPSKILCPVDFSELSDLALKYAAAGARLYDAALVVFHAARFELPAYFTRAQIAALTREHRTQQKQVAEFLRRHVQKVLGGNVERLRVQFETTEAHPVDAILAAAQRRGVDLIVMGTHGRSGARRLWLGSVAEHVVRQATVPVFVARQKQHEFIPAGDAKSAPGLKTILCPIDRTEASQAALAHAASLARQFQSRLVAPWIVDRGGKGGIAQARRDLASRLKAAAVLECDAPVVASKGNAAERIVTLAASTQADLVVMGADPRGSFGIWLAGDRVEFVLRHAPAPVLVVPS
jgi:nucleotide-binding universal stress UspA family protein